MTVTLIHPRGRNFVSKPWGWEDWYHNTPEPSLCMKQLFVKASRATSMHKHIVKEEVIACESGHLVVEFLIGTPTNKQEHTLAMRQQILTAGMAVHVMPGVWHRLAAIEDTYLWETSTFHEDADSVRLPGHEEFSYGEVQELQHPDRAGQ